MKRFFTFFLFCCGLFSASPGKCQDAPLFPHPSGYVTAMMEDDATPLKGEPSFFAGMISDLNALKSVSGVPPDVVQKIQTGIAAISKMSSQHNMDDFPAVIEMGKALIGLYRTMRASETPSPTLLAAFEPFANHDNKGFPEGITFFIERYLSVYIGRYTMQIYQKPVPQWVLDGMLDLMEMCGEVNQLTADHSYFVWMFSRHWESVKTRLASLDSAQRERIYMHVWETIDRGRVDNSFGYPMTPTDATLAEQRMHWARTHIQP